MNAAMNPAVASTVVVCGLGTLGQCCVARLKDFGASVVGIDAKARTEWQLRDAPKQMERLVAGDCRDPAILEEAGIRSARAILIATNDEHINIVTAFAARTLNPNVRIVVRSGQVHLNELLGRQLDNYVAFEPTQISASAFALAALGDETLGLFRIDGRTIRVVQKALPPNHKWCGRRLHELNSRRSRLLSRTSAGGTAFANFDWDVLAPVQAGETLVYLELDAENEIEPAGSAAENAARSKDAQEGDLRARARRLWGEATRAQQVATVSAVVLSSLYVLGVLLYKHQYGEISLHDALNVSLVLIVGGYDNVFGSLKLPFPIPPWLHLFSVLETVAGTIFIGIVYAFLTERVLSARFQFRGRRPPLPRANHVVLIGLGRVGTRVASLLAELKQPLVGADARDLDPETLPGVPFIRGSGVSVLGKVNVETAASVLALTHDEVANLEIALLANQRNPSCRLVIRTEDEQFSRSVSELVPHARAFGVHTLAAEAFAAAAFGENILNLLHVDGRTMLVTEYHVESGDTFDGVLFAEVAYGYGLVPLVHRSKGEVAFLPGDDGVLRAGDTLVVLGTIEGLQSVEQRTPRERLWLIGVESALSQDAAFDGAMTIARVSGCDVGMARGLMAALPGVLAFPMYEQQAHRLVRELAKARVQGNAIPP